MSDYPFVGEKTLDKSKLITWLAEHLYPTETNARDTKKKVRNRWQAASKKGLVPFADNVEASQFFSWAVGVWPKLQNLPGRPAIVTNAGFSVTASCSSSASATIIPELPKDYDELCQLYLQIDRERQLLGERLEDCELKLAAKQKRSSECSANGKKGGRPKK